jgi:uncharacterized protein YjbI with pentapeptide repeats
MLEKLRMPWLSAMAFSTAVSHLSMRRPFHEVRTSWGTHMPIHCRGWIAAGVGAVVLMALASVSAPGGALAADCRASPNAEVDWSGCRKRNLILSGENFSAAKLGGADFTATDLSKTILSRADFTKATLIRASLAETSAPGATFERSVGSRTVFRGADLAEATFYKAEMQRADFSGAGLRDVNFDHSDLGRADFSGADLTGARFQFTVLARADFRGSTFAQPIDLTGAYLFLTRLEGIDLSTVQGLEQWQVDMSCGDDGTKLPDGLNRPARWPCGDE